MGRAGRHGPAHYARLKVEREASKNATPPPAEPVIVEAKPRMRNRAALLLFAMMALAGG